MPTPGSSAWARGAARQSKLLRQPWARHLAPADVDALVRELGELPEQDRPRPDPLYHVRAFTKTR